ncbi:MAG: LTA synthase family protein [Clostridiales bacterium]|nr:LTA synthase family protein [Clostridiales bacterium]
MKRFKKPGLLVITFLLLLFLIGDPLNSVMAKSINNQEFFSYHLSDVFKELFTRHTAFNADSFVDTYNKEKRGQLFGTAQGKNLVIIQVESFQNFVINRTYNGQEITPNLNKLLKENTTYFPNFFQQIGSGNTSDAELAVNNSIIGTLDYFTYKIYEDNCFNGLPWLLKDKGYATAVFHAYEGRNFWNRETVYPKLGFDKFYGGLNDQGRTGDYEMTEWMGWGLTDSEFFKQVIPQMKSLKEPFYSFVITLSNHHPFEMLPHYDFINLLKEDEGTIVGNYLNSVAYTDYSIGLFMDLLKEEGLYDSTIFVIYGDHLGITNEKDNLKDMKRLLGREYSYMDMLNVPLIIHIPSSEDFLPKEVKTVSGQLDVFPTVAYLMGFSELNTFYLGHNIYNVKSGFVAEQTFMPKGSFISDDIVYIMSRDGVFEHGEAFTFSDRKKVDLSRAKQGHLKSLMQVEFCESLLKENGMKEYCRNR